MKIFTFTPQITKGDEDIKHKRNIIIYETTANSSLRKTTKQY